MLTESVNTSPRTFSASLRPRIFWRSAVPLTDSLKRNPVSLIVRAVYAALDIHLLFIRSRDNFSNSTIIEGSPFSYVLNCFPPDIGQNITKEALIAKPALVILEEDFGIKVSQSIQTVGATIADAEVAPLLKMRVGEPLLKVERTVFEVKKRPVEYVSVLYRADKYCFTVKLERKRSKDFVGWEAV